jgi:hypothetical protein
MPPAGFLSVRALEESMNRIALLGSSALLAGLVIWGCGSSESTTDSTGPSAGGASGGAGTSAAGKAGTGTAGTGTAGQGTAGSGTAGQGTGGQGTAGQGTAGQGTAGQGTAGSGTAGQAGAAAFFPNPYNPNTQGDPGADHHVGDNCFNAACHDGTNNEAPKWLFGGTVFKADKTTGAAHVEVGVKDPGGFYSTYTANNGNFFVDSAATINWASAEIRIRNANGERKMNSQANNGCNVCHTGAMVIVEP